jgi:hypothetical protein
MRGTIPGESPEHCRYGAAVTGEKVRAGDPATLVWAVRLLYLQSAGLAGLTGWLVFLDLTSDTLHVGMAVALTVLAALGAASVFVVARGLGRRAAGARGPAVVVQLFVIASGGFLIQVDPLVPGLGLVLLGVVTGTLIVLPPSTRALGVD